MSFALLFLLIFCVENCTSRLIFSVLIFRHGERQRYDPLQPEQKCYKHLINQGMRQQYISGRYFRSRYKKLEFLPNNPSLVYFRSTFLERALVSTLAFYSGLYADDVFMKNSLYPNLGLPIRTTINKYSLEIQNVNVPAIYTLRSNEDRLLYSYKKLVCPVIEKYRSKNLTHDRTQDYIESGLLGEEALEHPFGHIKEGPKLIRLATHNLLLQIVNYMKLALADTDKKRDTINKLIEVRDHGYKLYQEWRKSNPEVDKLNLVVYGSHDSMIVSLLNGLGIQYDKRVSVSSVISFELFDDPKPLLQVWFNGKLLNIPTCKKKGCTLNQFVKAITKYGTFKSDKEYLKNCINNSSINS